jgi:spore maturation protein CgeB
MTASAMRIVFLGLSLSSSWGNGHATTYRALIKALAMRGHDVLFLERDTPWYASHRDVADPDYCRLVLYDSVADLRQYKDELTRADAVIVGSFVPQGIEVIRFVHDVATGVKAFYDIDTPVTITALEEGSCEYLSRQQIAELDVYLSFTGGPLLDLVTSRFGARAAVPLYCSADVEIYRPQQCAKRWDLGYLGTYSPDRQPGFERLLLEPARRRPDLRFVVAGAQYPSTTAWPRNVEHLSHLAPCDHPTFYASLRWTLNLTRADMVRAGYSPSVRLFEAAACGTPIISDPWTGLDSLFVPEREIMLADTAEAALAALDLPAQQISSIGARARQRILAEHTSQHRAAQLETALQASCGLTKPAAAAVRTRPPRNRTKVLTFQAETCPRSRLPRLE